MASTLLQGILACTRPRCDADALGRRRVVTVVTPWRGAGQVGVLLALQRQFARMDRMR
jgi:hypothetical protein